MHDKYQKEHTMESNISRRVRIRAVGKARTSKESRNEHMHEENERIAWHRLMCVRERERERRR
jgi:hypothetical protein